MKAIRYHSYGGPDVLVLDEVEQAGAVPVAGISALQAVRDKGGLTAGQRVLVNGAAGGVGSFAVQIAVAHGAEVTAVCGTSGVELVRSLGAAEVVDYTAADFTATGPYDLIIDNAGQSHTARVPAGAHGHGRVRRRRRAGAR